MTGDLLSIILSPAVMSSKKKQKPKTNKKMGKEKQPKHEEESEKGISRRGVAVSLLNPKTVLKFSLKL